MTRRLRRAPVGAIGVGLAGIAAVTLYLGGAGPSAVLVASAAATTDSAVAVSTTAPPIENGVPYLAPVTIQPYTTELGSAAPLSGCYLVTASGLPTGIAIHPSRVCVPKRGVPSLVVDLTGMIRMPPGRVLTAASVTLSVYRAGPSGASGAALGTLSVSLAELPRAAHPSSPVKYANTVLTGVDCPSSAVCWVMGTSSNPNPAPTPGLAGTRPVWVTTTGRSSSEHIRVPEGGGFIAQLLSVTPLHLRFVRTGIPDPLDAFSCTSASTCMAVGSDTGQPARPLALEMTDGGAHWHLARVHLAKGMSGAFRAITCPSTDDCLLVGTLTGTRGTTAGFSETLAVTTGGLRPRAVNPVASADALGGVSCVDTTTCIATGQSTGGPTDNGRILISHDGGRAWAKDQVVAASPLCHRLPTAPCPVHLEPWFQLVQSQIGFGGLASIGCTRGVRYSCATVWTFWSAIADTTDGSRWEVGTLTAAPYELGNGNYSAISPSVSCPSAGRCFAVEAPLVVCGPDFACTHTAILESIPHPDSGISDAAMGAGWEWGLAGYGPPGVQQPALTAISCARVDDCVAVGRWQPDAPSGWGATFPLVIAPQSAAHPFFVPTTSGGWTFLTTMVPLALGAGALILSAGGAAPLLVTVLGFTSTVAGAAECSQGNGLGCVSAALGGGGLLLEVLGLVGLASIGSSGAAGGVEFVSPAGDFLLSGGDGSTVGVAILPSAETEAGGALDSASLAVDASGNVVDAVDPGFPSAPGQPLPGWLETPAEPAAGPEDE